MRRISKIITLLYAALYVLFAYAIRQDNLRLGYPDIFVFCSTLAQSIVVNGIVLSTFDHLDARLRDAWRWLFPLLILEIVVGISMDATIPGDFNLRTHGAPWIFNLLINLSLVAPGYYLNFKVAYR